MPTYNPITLNRTQSDTDAIAILNAITSAGVTPTAAMTNAAHFFVTACKWASLWTKFTAVYGLMGGTAASHAINWKTPGTYDIINKANATWTGMTHSANGVVGTTGKYGDTGINLLSVMSQDSLHLSVYQNTFSSGGDIPIGCLTESASKITVVYPQYVDGKTYCSINSASYTTMTVSDGLGMTIGTRTGANSVSVFRKSRLMAKGTTASNTMSNRNIWIMGANGDSAYSLFGRAAFFSIGSGLTSLDAFNLSWIVQATQKLLNRDV